MNVPDNLQCLFSAKVDEQRGSYVVEVPERELTDGSVRPGEVYRVALLHTNATAPTQTAEQDRDDSEPVVEAGDRSLERRGRDSRSAPGPPVAEGDRRTVDIEAIGEQDDGIARVERGFVIIVPDTEKGERVTIEVADVKANVAFGDVIAREDYYE